MVRFDFVERAVDSSDQAEDAGPPQAPEDLRATIALVGQPDRLPQVGDFEIDDEGRLKPRSDGKPIAFGFSYRGVDFIAEVHTGGGARIRLSAELGKLPYRAEAGDRRDLTRRVVDATEGLPHGRISLSASQDVLLGAETPAPVPLTPASLMAAMTTVLLDFKPYIDLLHEVMLVPDASAG